MSTRTAEEQAAIDAQRKGIAVTKNNPDVKAAAGEEKDNNEEEGEEKEEKDNNEEEQDDKNEENDEEIEEGEETNEEGEEKDEKEVKTSDKSIEKLEKTIARLQRRLDKKTGSEKQLQKQINDLQAAVDAKKEAGENVLTEEEVQTRAERIAAEKVAEREFTKACNKLAADATKVDKDFDDKVKAMGEDIGPIPSVMIGVLEDLDNGGAVLAHLVNNVDDAEEIYALPVGKMALKLGKLSEELIAKSKPKKPISKVPEPNEPISASQRTPAFDPRNTKMSDKEWIEKRNQQVAARNAAKRAAMR